MRPNERTVTLHDGSEVSNYSEEHRHECEARTVLAMPSKRQRQDYLWGKWDPARKRDVDGVLQRRGEAEVKRLEATILAIWEQRKQKQSAA
jgi:Ni,Fe-hydrogenase maturation factor